jgi:hypothetical protein
MLLKALQKLMQKELHIVSSFRYFKKPSAKSRLGILWKEKIVPHFREDKLLIFSFQTINYCPVNVYLI